MNWPFPELGRTFADLKDSKNLPFAIRQKDRDSFLSHLFALESE
jgi:hypothetical protein